MEWIKFEDKKPEIGQFVLAIKKTDKRQIIELYNYEGFINGTHRWGGIYDEQGEMDYWLDIDSILPKDWIK